jgi:hypothetical protein
MRLSLRYSVFSVCSRRKRLSTFAILFDLAAQRSTQHRTVTSHLHTVHCDTPRYHRTVPQVKGRQVPKSRNLRRNLGQVVVLEGQESHLERRKRVWERVLVQQVVVEEQFLGRVT